MLAGYAEFYGVENSAMLLDDREFVRADLLDLLPQNNTFYKMRLREDMRVALPD